MEVLGLWKGLRSFFLDPVFVCESFYGTPTLITRIGTETGSLVEGTGLGPATPSK